MSRFAPYLPPWALSVMQLCVAAGLMALLWRAADGPEAARSLAAADWPWLALAIGALTLQTVLSALRWQLTAGRLGMTLGTGHAVGEYYLAQVVNQALPGGVLGDAGRAYRARAAAGLVASGQAVVFERLAGQIALYLTFAAAFGATFVLPGGLDWPVWALVPAAVVLLAGLALPMLLAGAMQLPGRTGDSAARLWRAFARAVLNRQVILGQIALSLGTTFCNLAAFAFCARAVGLALPVPAIAALVPLILLTMLIPLSVSGWGFREGAAAALLPLAGATGSGGLAASVAFGLVFIASALPGLAYFWLKPRAIGLKP